MSVAVLYCLCDVFGRSKSPRPNAISESCLSQLRYEINVGVTNSRRFQWRDFVKYSHRVVVHDQYVVNITQDVGIIPRIVSRSCLGF